MHTSDTIIWPNMANISQRKLEQFFSKRKDREIETEHGSVRAEPIASSQLESTSTCTKTIDES